MIVKHSQERRSKENYRVISLLSISDKGFLSVLLRRMKDNVRVTGVKMDSILVEERSTPSSLLGR